MKSISGAVAATVRFPAMEMLCWSSSSCCSPCHCGFAFLSLSLFLFFSFLSGTSFRPAFGLPSPLTVLLKGIYQERNMSLLAFSSILEHRLLWAQSILSHLGSNVGCETQWHLKDLQASHLASQLLRNWHLLLVFLYHSHPPLTGISNPMCCLRYLCVGTWIASSLHGMTLSPALPSPGLL